MNIIIENEEVIKLISPVPLSWSHMGMTSLSSIHVGLQFALLQYVAQQGYINSRIYYDQSWNIRFMDLMCHWFQDIFYKDIFVDSIIRTHTE